jgi:hypothetical protein
VRDEKKDAKRQYFEYMFSGGSDWGLDCDNCSSSSGRLVSAGTAGSRIQTAIRSLVHIFLLFLLLFFPVSLLPDRGECATRVAAGFIVLKLETRREPVNKVRTGS